MLRFFYEPEELIGKEILVLVNLESKKFKGIESQGMILAVDVDEYSVVYAGSKGINAIQSDLFQNVDGKFDLVIFNPPYLPKDIKEKKETARLVSGGRVGNELINEFLSKSGDYLNSNGKILLAFSSLSGDVLGCIDKNGFR